MDTNESTRLNSHLNLVWRPTLNSKIPDSLGAQIPNEDWPVLAKRTYPGARGLTLLHKSAGQRAFRLVEKQVESKINRGRPGIGVHRPHRGVVVSTRHIRKTASVGSTVRGSEYPRRPLRAVPSGGATAVTLDFAVQDLDGSREWTAGRHPRRFDVPREP